VLGFAEKMTLYESRLDPQTDRVLEN
jgi:hypothetical protein